MNEKNGSQTVGLDEMSLAELSEAQAQCWRRLESCILRYDRGRDSKDIVEKMLMAPDIHQEYSKLETESTNGGANILRMALEALNACHYLALFAQELDRRESPFDGRRF